VNKEYRNILLLKVPHCVHPEAGQVEQSFRQKHTFRPIPSLALALLCAFLEKHNTFGYRIEAVDVNILAYTKPGVPIEIGEYPRLMEEEIRRRDYSVLALSTMFVFNARWLQMAVDLSRKYHPDAKIIAGGGYPTVFPERCLSEYALDSLVIGEGESTLVHLLNRMNDFSDPAFEKKFPFEGYGVREPAGEISLVPHRSYLDMEDIPKPAWDYLHVSEYFERSGDKGLPIEAVRGCPYRCTFCNTHMTWGYQQRYKDVDTLISEMKEMDGRYGAQLRFIDDNRSVDRDWMIYFLEKVIQEKIVLDPAPSSFHVNHLDGDMIDMLKKAGVKTVGIGVETGSVEMQRLLKKNLNLDKVREIVSLIKTKGLRVHINYMVGFPGETRAQIEETLNLARELKAHSNQFLILVPYPGTEIFMEAKLGGLIAVDDSLLDNFDPRKSDFLFSDEWSYAQLSEIIYDANVELNFLSNPALADEDDLDSFLVFLENLVLRIPGHVVAMILAGYIYRKKGNSKKAAKYYEEARRNLGEDKVAETFAKYLEWDFPPIHDFNTQQA
jgi:anaerobic magnesium-protoporphyrin IX monomethyl ester cyclase